MSQGGHSNRMIFLVKTKNAESVEVLDTSQPCETERGLVKVLTSCITQPGETSRVLAAKHKTVWNS